MGSAACGPVVMADGIRGVIPYPMPAELAVSLAREPRLQVACPVCADLVAEADVVMTSAGAELSIPSDQRDLLHLHQSLQHPEHTSLQGVI